MKLKYFILILFIFIQFAGYSQMTITLSICGPNTFTVIGTDATGRNIYHDGGASFSVQWNIAAGQWEIVEISPALVWHANTYPSTPNPPCFGTGTWQLINDPYACGTVTDITGSCQTTVTGIEEVIISNDITVFPNPGYGQYNFSGLVKENSIEIYDLAGRLVLQTVATSSLCSINLSGKDKGVYWYRIMDENKKIKLGKLIVL
ncbi:MAG: T9SS type A sorting domain-containing protein [Bacteroidia bacterium]